MALQLRLCYYVVMGKNVSVMFYEHDLPDWSELRCMKCGTDPETNRISRLLCRVNKEVKVISFDDGPSPRELQEIAAGMAVVEHKCRGCDTVYKLYFQK